jgi:hypothetical protein
LFLPPFIVARRHISDFVTLLACSPVLGIRQPLRKLVKHGIGEVDEPPLHRQLVRGGAALIEGE